MDAFFEQLIDDPCFVSEKSLKYIEEYYGIQEAYIHWEKKDYYADGSERKISKEMDEMLWRIDLHDNAILPFRYDFHSITLHTRFLAVNKKELAAINSEIQAEGMKYKDEKCKDCYLLGEHLKTKHSADSKLIENKRYMCTFEDIARTVFKEYGVPFKANVPVDYTGLRNTSFMKCIMIVIDIMNGRITVLLVL